MVTSVLFDLYGTLLDLRLNEDHPALWQGLAGALEACGGIVEPPADLRRRFRQILREESRHTQEGFLMEPVFARLLASVGARPEVARLGRVFRQLSIEEMSIRPYVAPLFEALRQTSCRLGIVSNTEAVLTRFDLERWPILLSVDAVVLSSDVGVRKPDRRIFHLALDRLHVEAASTVFVGNSLGEDIDGARHAGLRAVHLDEGATDVEPLHGDPSVLRVPPTHDALTRALRRFGWQPPFPASSAGTAS